MTKMSMIAAVDAGWAIGYKNDVLIRIPEDRTFFRKHTVGNIIIVGRRTLESFPGGLPLKDRTNIVITSNKDYYVPQAVVVHSITEAAIKAIQISEKMSADIYVAGGEQIYRQMEQYCTDAYITYIYHKFEHSDAFFPELTRQRGWVLKEYSDLKCYEDIIYEYRHYVKETRYEIS